LAIDAVKELTGSGLDRGSIHKVLRAHKFVIEDAVDDLLSSEKIKMEKEYAKIQKHSHTFKLPDAAPENVQDLLARLQKKSGDLSPFEYNQKFVHPDKSCPL
jgi:hypothetical protein